MEILDFYAPGCGQCKALARVLDRIEKDNVCTIKKIDLSYESAEHYISEYEIRNIPVMVIKYGDNKEEIIRGLVTYDTLKEKLNSLK